MPPADGRRNWTNNWIQHLGHPHIEKSAALLSTWWFQPLGKILVNLGNIFQTTTISTTQMFLFFESVGKSSQNKAPLPGSQYKPCSKDEWQAARAYLTSVFFRNKVGLGLCVKSKTTLRKKKICCTKKLMESAK